MSGYRAGTRQAPATAPGDGRRGSMDAKVVDVPERGRFEVRVDDRVVGLASYHVDGTTMTLPHTDVDPSVGGQGIGTALVAGVLAAARERGLTVLPYCSFIRHSIQQHREQMISSLPRTGRTSAWRPPTAEYGPDLRCL